MTRRLLGRLLVGLVGALAFSHLLADRHVFGWPFVETFAALSALSVVITLSLLALPTPRAKKTAVNLLLGTGLAVVLLGFVLQTGEAMEWRFVTMLGLFTPVLALCVVYAIAVRRRT